MLPRISVKRTRQYSIPSTSRPNPKSQKTQHEVTQALADPLEVLGPLSIWRSFMALFVSCSPQQSQSEEFEDGNFVLIEPPTAPIGQRTAPAAPRTPRQGKIVKVIVKIGKKRNRHFGLIVLSSVKAILFWTQFNSYVSYLHGRQ